MSLMTVALLVLLLPAPVPTQTATWTIDPRHSLTQFTVRHMLVANVHGEFDGPTGTVQFDPKHLVGTIHVEAVIDARSINTRNAERDADLKSDDFFDVNRYQTITFKSTRAEATTPGKFKLYGDLTIHGITKAVVLDVEGPTPTVKDNDGLMRMGASATTTIDRRDFGLRYNELLEAGGAVVSDEVRITIDIEIARK